MIDTNTILAIISTILTIIATLLGAKWQKTKGKVGTLADALTAVYEAAKDDKVTEEEFQLIVDKFKSLVEK